MQSLSCEVHGKIDEYERAAARKAKNGSLEKRPYTQVSEVFETSLTSWNSFNVRLFTHNWLSIPKHIPHLLTVKHTCHR